jgi:hypothetical protein
MPQPTLHINISGPGRTFSFELTLIKEVLEKEGFELEIEDEFPDNRTVNELRAEIKEMIDKRRNFGHPSCLRTIRITANHRPWGG